jgi:hypothetical protein
MTKVLGLTAFGLNDALWPEDGQLEEKDFTLQNVILPSSDNNILLAGMKANNSRVHTGYSWPLEARLGDTIRRVPLAIAWRAMIEAGDQSSFWHQDGFQWPLGKILACYLAQLVNSAHLDTDNYSLSIAIADSLDEIGQESLLQELSYLGFLEPTLLWRSVAATFSWLDIVADQLKSLEIKDDDHFHILYLGSDAFEFTTLRLRKKMYQGRPYILPLRDRPEQISDYSGLDWAGQLVEKCCQGDASVFWQLFTKFSDFWQLVSDQNIKKIN